MAGWDFQYDYSDIRDELLEDLESNRDGKKRLKIKTLLSQFGFTATKVLRQSSLAEVLRQFDAWGIGYQLPEGRNINSYITLSLAQGPGAVSVEVPRPPVAPKTDTDGEIFSPFSPFSFAFRCGDALDEFSSQTTALDIQNAIWACNPVCLLIQAEDEFFSFACGFLGAIMRRRAFMTRGSSPWIASSPKIVTLAELKSSVGVGFDSEGDERRETFPVAGDVYVLRVQRDDPANEDVPALIRDCLIPHSYALEARFMTTSGSAEKGPRAEEHEVFGKIKEWFKGFSGSLDVKIAEREQPREQLLDMASLMAEAAQVRDRLLDARALCPTDVEFRAGFESSEHMLLKSCLLNGLRVRFPGESVAVEELTPHHQESEFRYDGEDDESHRDRPDLLVGKKVWIEVETLRSGPLFRSNPFFQLESKLRNKLRNMGTVEEVWLMFPSDLALLAIQQLSAVTEHLRTLLVSTRVRLGFVDLLRQQPVFLETLPIKQPEVLELVGASWRTSPPSPPNPPTWEDVAGYSDLKERLKEDLLEPLLEPEKYSRHGMEAASGLLLYGLPGCGKTLIGKVLAGAAGLDCRLIYPSDLTAKWIGWGVGKIRDLFDWAIKHAPCLLIIDELDAVAPQRQEGNMHTDEKRQVNELLVQLDRIAGTGVVVVATTNYVKGIDSAVRRTGRFDIKLPILPPNVRDRQQIFEYYLSPRRIKGFEGIERIDTARLAEEAVLFTPSDIEVVVNGAARRAIQKADQGRAPILSLMTLLDALRHQPRSVSNDMAQEWLSEAQCDLRSDDAGMTWLKEEINRAGGV